MKKILIISGIVGTLIVPTVASAQQWFDYAGGTVAILDTYIYWSAIVIALVAIGLVFSNAKKMEGGVFSSVLNLFGTGMLATFLGFLTIHFPEIMPLWLADFLPNTLFIIGYVVMAIAASRLARAISS